MVRSVLQINSDFTNTHLVNIALTWHWLRFHFIPFLKIDCLIIFTLNLPLGFVLDFLFFWISFRWTLATIRIALNLSFLDFQRMLKSLRRRTVSTFRRIHTQRFTNSMKVAKWKSPTLKCLTFSLHYVWKPPIWINRRAVQHMLCSLGLLLWFWSVGVDLLLLLLWLSLIFKHFYGCLLFLFLPLWSFAAYLLLFSPSPKTYLETSPYSLNHFFAPFPSSSFLY